MTQHLTTDRRPRHGHAHDAELGASPLVVRIVVGVLALAALAVAVGMVALWPRGGAEPPAYDGPQRAAGQVVSVALEQCPAVEVGPDGPPGAASVCGEVVVDVTDGPGAGQRVTTEVPAGPGAPEVRPGDGVVLIVTGDDPNGVEPVGYQITDRQRGWPLGLVVAAVALAVVAFGRWRGAAALVSLGVTFAVLLLFVLPAILAGRSPLLVAVVGGAAIMLVVLPLTHGPTARTAVALLGTLAALTLTAVLGAVATAAAALTGIAGEESAYISEVYPGVDMRGLLLAGIVIGSLGVLDDVAVTQAATVGELARADPGLDRRALYGGAIRVGRAHIASVVNTIVLAYVGAALPLLLLIAAARSPLREVLTGELIGQEVVRSAVGTVGLIAAVPLTTALAALVVRRGVVEGRRHRG